MLMNIPEQYLPVMPYLILEDASAFLEFAKSVFGAKEQLIVPAADNKIMHGELKIHDAVIMFANSGANWNEMPSAMYMHVLDVKVIYEKAMELGAKSLGEPGHKEYGYTAGFEDPFGNQWFVVEAKKDD
jgi:PhnB protein